MARKFPDYIAVSPITLSCPRCNVKPGKACELFSGEVEIVHLERIAAAAAMDVAAKKARNQGGSPVKGNTARWMELARLAAEEQDPKKLLALVKEINELLELKRERLEHQPPEPSAE